MSLNLSRTGIVATVAMTAILAVPATTGAGEREQRKRAAALAESAGCVLKTFRGEGASHTEEPVAYKTNPPTSGPHHPEWAEDGIYPPGEEPAVERWVHTLEHGRVLLQYAPGASSRRIAALRSLYRERFSGRRGYHQLLFANNTKMRFAVAAVAWRRYLGCHTYNARVARAIRAFRVAYVDRGPEMVP